ncbi:MAG: thioredoxin family protein [Planctomycetota bacterium]|nr:MAG: thioredoxin family protein [Planctomycetota bacterium]REJ89615.1 MAG: thioredoxin family protein [Planctomycetota bacterium]REK24326.1 MAG: thioredoxin family protein [Planctomycetota bacterium]REK34641.1 MAG: thioredoxin family protein [Planctomycetota bacterium]
MRRKLTVCASLMLVLAAARFAQAEEIEVGAEGPDFSAVGTDGETYTLDSFKDSDVVVLCFTCNYCPVAVAYEDRFIEFTEKYDDKKVSFVAINCNNQTEGLAEMQKRAEEKGFNFIYAFDESGEAAKDYGARVTPHLFILDKDRNVAYRGSFDDKQKGPTEHYVANAVDALLAGETPEVTSTKAFGCGIKLKE